MNYLRFMWMTFRNRLLEEYRYPLQAFVNLAVFAGFFFLIASGSTALIGGDAAVNFARLFIAFFLGVGLTSIMHVLADKGSMEEFYLYPMGSVPMLIAAGIGRILEAIPTMALLVFIVPGLLMGRPDLSLRFLVATPVVGLFALGLGLVIAGLSLVYRRLGQLPQMLMLLLIGYAVGVPDTVVQASRPWFPLSAAVAYLREAQTIPWSAWGVSVLTFLLGIVIFQAFEKRMFQRGLISQE